MLPESLLYIIQGYVFGYQENPLNRLLWYSALIRDTYFNIKFKLLVR